MEIINVRSKMEEKDLKNYLLFDKYYGSSHFVMLRVIISLVVGAFAGYYSQQHVVTFLLITGICLAVLLYIPKAQIGFKAPQVYRRNRSGAFHQAQDFAFGETRFGFKSESEEAFDWTNYRDLNRAVETKSLLVLEFQPKQRAVMVKKDVPEEDLEAIRRILTEEMREKFTVLDRL